MDRFEFYKNSYFKGLERKHKLNRTLSIPIGAVAFLGSILYYYLISVFDFVEGWPKWVFIVLLIISAFTLVAAIYNIIKSYYNYGYRYIPPNTKWEEYYENLEDHYNNNSSRAKGDLKESVIDELAESHEFNYNNNNIKSKHLYRANGFVIVTIIIVLLTSVPYFFNYSKNNTNKPEQSIHYIMPEDQDKNKKPKPPEGEIIKEGDKPTNKKSSQKNDNK